MGAVKWWHNGDTRKVVAQQGQQWEVVGSTKDACKVPLPHLGLHPEGFNRQNSQGDSSLLGFSLGKEWGWVCSIFCLSAVNEYLGKVHRVWVTRAKLEGERCQGFSLFFSMIVIKSLLPRTKPPFSLSSSFSLEYQFYSSSANASFTGGFPLWLLMHTASPFCHSNPGKRK